MMKQKYLIVLGFVCVLFGCHRSGRDASPNTRFFANKLSSEARVNDNHPVEYSPAARLRKLSLTLRGLTPDLADYQELEKAISQGTTKSFFSRITAGYLASPQHIGKMVQRLDELFRVRSASGFPETRLMTEVVEGTPFPGAETFNAMDLLFAELAASNLSWDELLSAKHYFIPKKPPLASFPLAIANDRAFMGKLLPAGTPANLKPAADRVEFAASDSRIAGAITTARFLNRYNTTVLNRGRGRAAAMFRIFLCDEMKAVVIPKKDEDDALLKKAFPQAPKPDLDSHFASGDLLDDQHGQDAACMACHYKLDPMGKAFMNIGAAMAAEPASGALIYRRENGELVNIAAEGLGAIGAAIISQPEYARCQVQHFWSWFIRGDQPPSSARLEELVREFNRVGRKTNDFIEYLLETPEFVQDPGSPFATGVTLLQLKPLLSQCNSCHSGYPAKKIPSFTTFPIGGVEKHPHWIERIAVRLDLAHNGKDKSMPPEDSTWDLTSDEIRLIKEWVGGGAKDEDGKATIDSALAQTLVGGKS